jgi:hypothetical protein
MNADDLTADTAEPWHAPRTPWTDHAKRAFYEQLTKTTRKRIATLHKDRESNAYYQELSHLTGFTHELQKLQPRTGNNDTLTRTLQR